MSDPEFGLITIGNAMVDLLSRTDEDYIADQDEKFGMKKGSMNLIDEDRAETLYQEMQDVTQMAGGSAGNTMACYSSFGGKAPISVRLLTMNWARHLSTVSKTWASIIRSTLFKKAHQLGAA